MNIITKNSSNAWKEILEKLTQLEDNPEIHNLIVTFYENKNISEPIDLLSEKGPWIYPEKTELQEIMFSKNPKSNHHYTYGERILNFGGAKNQIDNFIIPLLTTNPLSRRAIITVYDPTQDSSVDNEEAPGIISIHFRILNNQLDATATIRSNNMLTGWPANIYQIYLIQNNICEKLNLKCGEICTISHSAHILKEQMEEAKRFLMMM